MNETELYNRESRLIRDTFYRGLENAEKMYETIGGHDDKAIFDIDGKEYIKFILSKPIAGTSLKLPKSDAISSPKRDVNSSNVYGMRLNLCTEQLMTPEMYKEYSWHLDANPSNPDCREFHEQCINTKYSQLSVIKSNGDKFAMESNSYSGLTNLQKIATRTKSGYSVMSQLSPEEFEMAKDIYEEIYGIENLHAEQAELKKSLANFNFNLASIAQKLKIDVPYKIIEN